MPEFRFPNKVELVGKEIEIVIACIEHCFELTSNPDPEEIDVLNKCLNALGRPKSEWEK